MVDDKLLIENNIFFSEVERMLSQGRSVTMRAKGSSMIPFIVEGRDKVTLQKSDNVEVGDILLVRLPGGRYVLHRVYAKRGDQLTLMGDGNRQAVEQCQEKDVVGKVTAIIRNNGREISCDSPSQRRKAAMWRHLLPMRRYLLFAYRHIKQLKVE